MSSAHGQPKDPLHASPIWTPGQTQQQQRDARRLAPGSSNSQELRTSRLALRGSGRKGRMGNRKRYFQKGPQRLSGWSVIPYTEAAGLIPGQDTHKRQPMRACISRTTNGYPPPPPSPRRSSSLSPFLSLSDQSINKKGAEKHHLMDKQ